MKLHKSDFLVLSMVIAGVSLLAFRYRPQPPVERPPVVPAEQREDLAIDLSELLSPVSFTFEGWDPSQLAGSEVAAVFVLHGEICPPCLNEASEFASLIEELVLSGVDVRSVALVFAEGARGEHFVRSAGLPMAAGYGGSREAARLLGEYDETTGELLQQLVFIDVARETLFFRTLLSNTTTSPEYKRGVLKRMLEVLPSARSLPTTPPKEAS